MARTFDEYASLPRSERLALTDAAMVVDLRSLDPVERARIEGLIEQRARRLVGDTKNHSTDSGL